MEKKAAYKVLYTLEHRLIPQWFYKDQRAFIDAVVADPTMIYRIVTDLLKQENEENTFSEEDFASMRYKFTEKVLALKISFPEPEMEPLCHCAYLVFDKDCNKIMYFTIEKTSEPDVEAVVCTWDKDSKHMNFGPCTFEEYGDLRKCAEIYFKIKYENE